MNDRQLRNVVDGLGGKANGVPREDGFDITVASEIMAIFCLASSITDLKERLSRIIVGYTYDDKPVTAGDLKAVGAMTALLNQTASTGLNIEYMYAFILPKTHKVYIVLRIKDTDKAVKALSEAGIVLADESGIK
jgi:formyltetrahydrofolate synthetase